jgi:hypothetical protein
VTEPHWIEAYSFGDRVEVQSNRHFAEPWHGAVVTGVQFGSLLVAVNVGPSGQIWIISDPLKVRPLK